MNWQNQEIAEEVKNEIDSFLKNPFFLLGNYTRQFEQDFAKSQNCEFFSGLSSGTVALQLMLRALELPQGSKVLVSSFCPIPTIMSIYEEGLIPKFTDVDKETLNITSSTLDDSFDEECSAVIAVHIFGKLCDMKDISQWCNGKKIELIEDACQAVNSHHNEYALGQFSRGAALSFYPTKNLGAWGDAGGILTNDKAFRKKINFFRNYGLNEEFESVSVGGNYRLDDLQALVLAKKLKLQSRDMAIRNEVFQYYFDSLDSSKFQKVAPEEYHNKHVVSYLLNSTDDRDRYRDFCNKEGLKTSFFYETPIYKKKGINLPLKLSNCEDICSRIINLPVYEKNQAVVSFLESLV